SRDILFFRLHFFRELLALGLCRHFFQLSLTHTGHGFFAFPGTLQISTHETLLPTRFCWHILLPPFPKSRPRLGGELRWNICVVCGVRSLRIWHNNQAGVRFDPAFDEFSPRELHGLTLTTVGT